MLTVLETLTPTERAVSGVRLVATTLLGMAGAPLADDVSVQGGI